ncbi:MAG: peptide chain release factor N(5)-glutamine methyltransferase [Bacteroidales bacterium]|nr:peptide chain release factor N(5)-glutamine methyltransferase [Bacteroidales bacterium]MDD3665908.1 peptide chain release factor N(5)-glutamine methyltransferase [Bacteroidales bacterium]
MMQIASNRVADVAAWYQKMLLDAYDVVEARIVVDWVLEEFTGRTRVHRFAHPEDRLSESEILKIHFAFKRIASGEPVQYVLHKAWFYGRPFYVDPAVLIPRRETEELVEWCLSVVQPGWRVLDIGSGSGCVGITLKLEQPLIDATLLDVSKAALSVSSRNGVQLGAGISLVESDILNRDSWSGHPGYNLIVSNPPYVRQSERKLMNGRVLNHEPALALFVSDADPLIYYRAIAAFAMESLLPGGVLFFEINEELPDQTVGLLTETGFEEVEVRNDMQNKPRMVMGVRR